MDKFEVIDLYDTSYKEHGRSVHALNWSSKEAADERLQVLLQGLEYIPEPNVKYNVLDVGCGFGDLMNGRGTAMWLDKYTGIDTNRDFIEIARQRYTNVGNAHFHYMDIMDLEPDMLGPKFEIVIANGTLAFYDHADIYKMVAKMWELTTKMLAFNFTRNDDIGLDAVNNMLKYVGIQRYSVRRDFGRLGEIAVYAYRDME